MRTFPRHRRGELVPRGAGRDVRARFPRSDRFAALLAGLDPAGRFRNAVVDRFFPGSPAPGK